MTVRSEKDPYSFMRMIDTNIFNTDSTMLMAKECGAKKYFCVSTDKAANPVNMMGVSKRIMEFFMNRRSVEMPVSTTRFANVAFSDGSLLFSTDYVFDGTGSVPYTEDMPVAPIGVYGRTKAVGEATVKQNLSEYYIIRTAWLYGWAGKNFVYIMIKAMNTHESVKVVNDQKESPIFTGDLAGVILKIINKNDVPYGTYHCTDLGEITCWDFTNEIKKQGIAAGYVNNKDCVVNPCTTDEYPTPAKRPAYSVLCKDKIQKTLGIQLPDWKISFKQFMTSELFDTDRIKS